MKKFVLAFLVIALAGSCFAVSIDVAESVPAKTVWSFSVTLPSAQDFSDADVLLDGSRIMSFYTYNDKIKSDEADIDKTKVFSNTEPIGNKVYFLVAPVSKGEHEISLEVDGEEETLEKVEFFEIYDADQSADFQTQLNSVRNTANSLLNQVADLESRMSEAESLKTSLGALENAVSGLEASLSEQETETGQKINVIMGDVQTLQSRTNDLNASLYAGTGLFSFFSLDSGVGMAIALIVIAVVVALAIIRYKDRLPSLKGSLYGRQSEKMSFSRHDEDIAEQVLTESQDESQKGKWAYGDFKQEKPQESKRFNIGDLIRK